MTDERGTLYVVATPIGNLADVTLRALEVLGAVGVVAAEDTRVTRKLLARHSIDARLVAYHANSGDRRREELLSRLRDGEDVALVTDAGTPIVSDPGEELVAAWAAEGGAVVPIPGASAVLAALVASGIPARRWGFEGFLPRKGAERRNRLARIAGDERTTVLFEAPGRTAATLADLAEACGVERAAAVCRELTKRYETTRRGPLGTLASEFASAPPRGEVTIVVAGVSSVAEAASVEEGRAEVAALVEAGLGRSAAARHVSARTGLPRRRLYEAD